MRAIAHALVVALLVSGPTVAAAADPPPQPPQTPPSSISQPRLASSIARPMTAAEWVAIAKAVGIPEDSPELAERLVRYRTESDALVAASQPADALAVAAAGKHGRLNTYIRGGAARAEFAQMEQRYDDALRRLEVATFDAIGVLAGPQHEATLLRHRDRRTRERCAAVFAMYPGVNVQIETHIETWLENAPGGERWSPPAERAEAWAEAIRADAAASATDDELRVESWRRAIIAEATSTAEIEALDDSGVSDEEFREAMRKHSLRRNELLSIPREREKIIADRNEATIEALAAMLPEAEGERLRDAYLSEITPNIPRDPLHVESAIVQATNGLDPAKDAATAAAINAVRARYRESIAAPMRAIRTNAVAWRRKTASTGGYRPADREAARERALPHVTAITSHAKSALEEIAAMLAPLAERNAATLRKARERMDKEAEQFAQWML